MTQSRRSNPPRPSPGSAGRSVHSPGDELALNTLRKLNSPSHVGAHSALVASRADVPPTPQLLSAVKERQVPEVEMDEDEIRTRRYWRRWGTRAARELMKNMEREKSQRIAKRRELVYSARMREPVFRQDSDESDTDSDTAISLLTTSSVARDAVTFLYPIHSTKKKKTNTEPPQEAKPKVDWEKFARRRSGMLDKMMRQDLSAVSGRVRGGETSVEPVSQERATEFMSNEERDMVLASAFRKGLYGNDKSKSTENVVTVWPTRKKLKTPTSGIIKPPPSPKPSSRASNVPSPIKSEFLPSRGCTPTPAEITQGLTKSKRSASISLGKPVRARKNSASSQISSGAGSVSKSAPNPTHNYMKGVQGLPDFEGTFSKRVRQRIRRTVSALDRIVGTGDDLDVIAEIPGETGRYTSEDYSRVPRYPQRVLITPHLAHVIKTDIRARMGRPRCHKILQIDMKYFDKQNPPLDRSHRNLLIFNWLINTSESEYEDSTIPEIVDLEGKLAEYRNVLKHEDVMSGRVVASSLSHVSGSDGEQSDFSMSAYSGGGEVSEEETEHVSEPGMSYLSSSRPGTSQF